MEKHKLAEVDYNEGMKYKDIALKYGVSMNTVKSWKSRHNWNRDKDALKEKGVHTKERGGAPPGNEFAKGNSGGAPAGNQNARTHGLFSKFLNDDALEIMDIIDQQTPADIAWDLVKIQYTAIIRSQKVMWVRDNLDHLDDKSGESWGEGGGSESRKVAYAYEQQAAFLASQSRAMSELRYAIKNFLDISDAFDERRKKIEIMDANLDKIKADTKKEGNDKVATVIVSNRDEMQAYLDAQKAAKAGDDDGESPDSSGSS